MDYQCSVSQEVSSFNSMNEITRKTNSSLLGFPGRGAQEGASKRGTRRQGCAGRRQMLWLRWATLTCRPCPGTWLLNLVLRSCETRQSATLTGGGDFCGHKCGIHLLIKAAQDPGFRVLASVGSLCWGGCAGAERRLSASAVPVPGTRALLRHGSYNQ